MTDTLPTAAPVAVRVLHGHTSPDRAFVADDYPYGYQLRCKKRYWIELALKGQKRGQQRPMEQTTNPKRGDVWNKPHAGVYRDFLFMYLDTLGHVQFDGLFITAGPAAWHYAAAGWWYKQLDKVQAEHFGVVMNRASALQGKYWVRWVENMKRVEAWTREGILDEATLVMKALGLPDYCEFDAKAAVAFVTDCRRRNAQVA
jgi:hypothetical protein